MRRAAIVALASFLVLGLAGPARATDAYFPVYTGEEFQALYEYAVANTLPNLNPPPGQSTITGNAELDARIWEAAFARGYVLRPYADGGLVSVDGVTMQPQAAEAWRQLRAEARAAGYPFVVSSAYRSMSTQRSWFNTKLSGTSDEAIDATLRWYSVPGTSKHHGGYALDFRHSNGTFGEFRSTPDYAWLSANNFAIPKKYGFIPSYPDDVENQGPNPEPWEFVWVGVEMIRCGAPLDLSGSRFSDSHRWLADEGVVRCPGGMSAEDIDDMIRTHGPKIEALLKV